MFIDHFDCILVLCMSLFIIGVKCFCILKLNEGPPICSGYAASNVRPLFCSFPLCKQWSQRVGNRSWLGSNSGLEAQLLRGTNPNSRKSKLGVGRKKGRLLQRSCVMWFKGENGWSWSFQRWRARRGGRRRCSRGCKQEEKCSSKQRIPPRPRPAPRCLFFLHYCEKNGRKDSFLV